LFLAGRGLEPVGRDMPAAYRVIKAWPPEHLLIANAREGEVQEFQITNPDDRS